MTRTTYRFDGIPVPSATADDAAEASRNGVRVTAVTTGAQA